jgi:hypothetical protein
MAMPSASGQSRRALSLANKSLQDQHIELLAEKAATNRQISNLIAQSPTQADRSYAGGFDKSREEYIRTIKDLESIVEPLITKYRDLARDQSVTDAIAQIRFSKLGPSDEIGAAVKLVQGLKANTASPKQKSTIPKKTSKSKSSTKPG